MGTVSRSAALAVIVAFAALASCARGPAPAARLAAAPPRAPAVPEESPTTAAAPVDSPGPPPRVVTPMAGDPDDDALAGARLVSQTCTVNQDARRALVQRRIAAMRAAVDEERKNFEQEPDCRSLREGIGDAFGAGGLGLSGVGEGGGGSGEGIGLGSFGAIGHAASASGTNNQVAGVDEADIVKNDGAYVYLAVNGALRIVEAMNPRLVSVTKLQGTPRNMVLYGDRAAVFLSTGTPPEHTCTYGYDCRFGGDGTSTRIAVYDVSDRAHPKLVRRIEASGSLMAARRIEGAVHVVVADNDTPEPEFDTWLDDLPYCTTPANKASVRARFEQLKRKNERKIRAAEPKFPTVTDHGTKRELCDIMHTALSDGEAFTSVLSFDLENDDDPVHAATVESRPGAVFAGLDALYFSVGHARAGGADAGWYGFYPNVNEVSDIHKFRIGARAGDTRYVGSGVVPGHVLNQFAMDEWYGYLRVATTRGRVPDPNVESQVSVLAETEKGSLVRVGAVEHLAPSEDIRAVRFDGDRGYVVTFKKTDPLFVVDLHRPAEPKVLGELKIPGFSTYLHRIDATHLLSIGYDANDHGDFAFFDGLTLQLFDVTRPTEPVLLHREKIGTRGSSSAAATDHLAFNYFDEKKLLAVPMTICEGGGDGTFGDRLTFSGLLVYEVSLDKGFVRLGGVDHGKQGASCRTWWSQADSEVKRSIFMDDLVFSIASNVMKVERMNRFGEEVASIPLSP
jgi:beta propeller domain-containing protein